MGFNGVLTDGAGGSAQTDLSNLVGLGQGWVGVRVALCEVMLVFFLKKERKSA